MAYALGPMRPEDRHERIFVKRRSRRLFVLLVALVAMIAASGGFLAFYRTMTRTTSPGELPLLRADTEPSRHKPDNPGGMQIPGQGTMVLDGGHGEPKVEQLLPPPEAPLPRPAATDDSPPPVVATAPAPATPTADLAPAGALATPAPVPEVKLAPPEPVAPAPPVAAAPPAPAPVAAAAPHAPPPPAPAAEGKGYRLQLGAVRSPEAASKEWERLKHAQADVLGSLGFAAQRVDLGERGIFYRIQAGPIADAAKAERDCGELKRRGVGCILVKP